MGHSILYVARFRFPYPTAQSIQILNTCRALAEEGAHVRLFATRTHDRPIRTPEEGLAFYGIEAHHRLTIELHPANNLLRSMLGRWRVWRAPRGTSFYSRHLAMTVTAARSGRGSVTVEVHSIEAGVQAAVAKAHAVVAVTSGLAERVRALRDDVPIHVIPDAVDPTVFSPVQGDHPPRLIYAGHLYAWKGVDVLVRALRELPGMTAIVFGGGPSHDEESDGLRALAQREGVADRIEWTGHVTQREIVARLRGGDIGVLPTRAQKGQEFAASPLKLFEYMSCGLPVIATDLPALREVIRDGENGVLFPDGDATALAAAVKRLAARPDERRALAECGRKDGARYTWTARARAILALLDTLRSRSSPGGISV